MRSPAIDLESHGLQVNTALTPWPAGDGPRRAGVSSFGMGGTNAHVIVEQAPASAGKHCAQQDERTVPIARGCCRRAPQQALANQAARLLAHVAGDADHGGRMWVVVGHHPVGVRASCRSGRRATVEHLTAGLAGLAGGMPGRERGGGTRPAGGKTVFVFPGQGSQWLGMGRQLYERFPVFAWAFDEAADGAGRPPAVAVCAR